MLYIEINVKDKLFFDQFVLLIPRGQNGRQSEFDILIMLRRKVTMNRFVIFLEKNDEIFHFDN